SLQSFLHGASTRWLLIFSPSCFSGLFSRFFAALFFFLQRLVGWINFPLMFFFLETTERTEVAQWTGVMVPATSRILEELLPVWISVGSRGDEGQVKRKKKSQPLDSNNVTC
ncbi:unnamed protein product, partial [Linum tenue]